MAQARRTEDAITTPVTYVLGWVAQPRWAPYEPGAIPVMVMVS
jgi:hypothetical protein